MGQSGQWLVTVRGKVWRVW